MSTSKSYHHGGLPGALVESALAQVEAGQPLSLREAARQAGVSATAVYRHFPDRHALLTAVAHRGLVRLGAEQHRAYDAAGGGVAGFNATGVAYVRFALAHPALFRLIFSQPIADAMDEGTGDDAMTFLLANAAALAPPGVDARVFALQCWSIAHGLAMLMLDGQVPADETLIARVVDVHAIVGC